MRLLVVVPDPLLVSGDEVGPAFHLGEVVVGHALLDAEAGLRVVLPGLALLDLLLADAQRLVDGPRAVGPEDGAGVGDQRLGGP